MAPPDTSTPVVHDFRRRIARAFPKFAGKFRDDDPYFLENVRPPATDEDLGAIETSLGVRLPESYKALLRCGREFWLRGGAVQFGLQHPFFHEFEPFESLAPAAQQMVRQKGGVWPPASDGMLCFAEFFMEADGDQVLFDVSGGLLNGEYPVMYYAHEAQPPSVRLLARSFEQFLVEFLDYPALARTAADDSALPPRPGPLSDAAKNARAPLAPEELVAARSDRVHIEKGKLIAAVPLKISKRK